MSAPSDRVVFVDDEEEVRRANGQSLDLAGFSVETHADAESALRAVLADPPGVVVTDVRLPGLDGLGLFSALQEADPELPVILITGHGDITMAVRAMRAGAYDFLAKPYPAETLVASVRRALERPQAGDREPLPALPPRRRGGGGPGLPRRLAGHHPPAPVRARGGRGRCRRDGAGRDRLGQGGGGERAPPLEPARQGQLRRHELRRAPDTVVESELFGHEAGAFTGALKKRVGRIAHADGGTLFLDEIESMALAIQVKLLRVLQERVVEPLGTNAVQPVDMRVVAATKIDLGQAPAQGTFRDDLYYRLNVVSVAIPPLRERREDVALLFEHFLRKAAARFNREPPPVTPSIREHLSRHDWPGNVRELGHFAERCALGLNPTGPAVPEPAKPATLAEQMDRHERGLIRDELIMAGGDVRVAAEALGTPRKTLYDKIARHGLDPNDYR